MGETAASPCCVLALGKLSQTADRRPQTADGQMRSTVSAPEAHIAALVADVQEPFSALEHHGLTPRGGPSSAGGTVVVRPRLHGRSSPGKAAPERNEGQDDSG